MPAIMRSVMFNTESGENGIHFFAKFLIINGQKFPIFCYVSANEWENRAVDWHNTVFSRLGLSPSFEVFFPQVDLEGSVGADPEP